MPTNKALSPLTMETVKYYAEYLRNGGHLKIGLRAEKNETMRVFFQTPDTSENSIILKGAGWEVYSKTNEVKRILSIIKKKITHPPAEAQSQKKQNYVWVQFVQGGSPGLGKRR